VESHNRAERATQAGYFKDQIVPVMLKSRKGRRAYATDEHFRPGCSMEDMAKLKPVFVKENGTVTAGNASGINDAAAAVVLMEAAPPRRAAQAAGPPGGLRPRRRGPQVHGHRPGAGHAEGAEKAGLTVNDLDVIEANEAFAAQACAVTRTWAWTRPRSTPTARASRWATPSAPPAR
jgi:acetyl-CoA C-acetyltransferase